MLAAHELVAFVAATDADRARSFYGDVLGLRLVEATPFALVFDAHGTTLRVQLVDDLEPAPFTVLGWKVPDIATTIRELTSRGVTFRRYDFLEQDELGVWMAPGAVPVAWFSDPDGNTLSLHQPPA